MHLLLVAMVLVDDLAILQLPPKLPCVVCINGVPRAHLSVPEHCRVFWDIWEGFSINRNMCLQHARDTLSAHERDTWWLVRWDADYAQLQLPAHQQNTYDTRYDVIQGVQKGAHSVAPVDLLIRASAPCEYVGVTHEDLRCAPSVRRGYDGQLSVVHTQQGASRAVKNRRDISLIELALLADPDLSETDAALHERYLFYLAVTRTFRHGCKVAMPDYNRYLQHPNQYTAHRFYMLYQRAVCTHDMDTFKRAHQADPARWEPLYHLAEHHRMRSEFDQCIEWAKLSTQYPRPPFTAFGLDRAIYEYGLAREWAVCLLALGKKQEARALWDPVRALAPASMNEWLDKHFD